MMLYTTRLDSRDCLIRKGNEDGKEESLEED